MFRNDKQLGDVCFILCAWIPQSPWAWAGDGYRRERFDLPDGISSGEAAMLRFAAALWGGDDLAVSRGFDGRRMRDVGALISALGGGPMEIDGWIRSRARADWQDNRSAWEADVRARARA